jgi:hypothetical protein
MAERYVDAAFSDGVNTATFFLADQYVVYDYGSDRVRDGVHPSTEFPVGAFSGFPQAFMPYRKDYVVRMTRSFLAVARQCRIRGGVRKGAVMISSGYALHSTCHFPLRLKRACEMHPPQSLGAG